MGDRNPLRDWLNRSMREAELRLITGTATTTQPEPAKPLDAEAMLQQWSAAMRESRRRDVTVVVVADHIGPPQITKHPTDGTFIECSYCYAAELHRDTPLRLHRVVSADRAEFKGAGPFGIVPRFLPAPLYGGGAHHA